MNSLPVYLLASLYILGANCEVLIFNLLGIKKPFSNERFFYIYRNCFYFVSRCFYVGGSHYFYDLPLCGRLCGRFHVGRCP